MTRQAVTPKVLAVLTDKIGQNVTTDEIARATGLERAQIQSVIARLTRDNGLPITTVVRGNMFRYEADREGDNGAEPTPLPTAKDYADSAPRTYTEVGITRNDEIIVRDENGTLFKLTDL